VVYFAADESDNLENEELDEGIPEELEDDDEDEYDDLPDEDEYEDIE